MHAAVLADQPLKRTVVARHFRKAHHRPRLIGQIDRVVINADGRPDVVAQVVPLHARDLTRLAADALRDVDQLGNRLARTRTCGVAVVVAERSWISSDCIDGMVSSYAFSMLTKNALYSGVCELASATYGVKVFARKPLFATPMKPQ